MAELRSPRRSQHTHPHSHSLPCPPPRRPPPQRGATRSARRARAAAGAGAGPRERPPRGAASPPARRRPARRDASSDATPRPKRLSAPQKRSPPPTTAEHCRAALADTDSSRRASGHCTAQRAAARAPAALRRAERAREASSLRILTHTRAREGGGGGAEGQAAAARAPLLLLHTSACWRGAAPGAGARAGGPPRAPVRGGDFVLEAIAAG